MRHKLLLMFLGGLPLDGDVADHWQNILQCCDIEIIKKLYVVVHPMKLTTESIRQINQSFWRTLFGDRLMINDNEHHVKTGWATRSISDATVLMMQYAAKQHKFKKIILLSNACCPIVKMNDIYTIMTGNNKSWIHASDNGSARELHPSILTDQGGLFTIDDMNYFSQWMALDVQHVEYFFINDSTYVVHRDALNKIDYKCKYGTTNKIIVNPNLQRHPKYEELTLLLKSFDGGSVKEDFFDNNNAATRKPCAPSDEHFFGSYILFNLRRNRQDIMNHIMNFNENNVTNNLNNLQRHLPALNALYVEQMQVQNKIEVPHRIQGGLSLNNMNIWTGPKFRLNSHGITNMHYSYCDIHGRNKKLYGSNDDVYATSNIECNNTCTGLYNDQCTHRTGTKDVITFNNHLLSCTYTDWTSYAIDPFNMLRSINITNNEISGDPTKNYQWYDFNINEFLNSDRSPSESYSYLHGLDEELISDNIVPLKYKQMDATYIGMMPNYHPMEYSSWSFKNMVNAFIFMSYLKRTYVLPENSWPASIFKWAHDKYRNIIIDVLPGSAQHFITMENRINDTNYYEEIEFISSFNGVQRYAEDLTFNKYGTFITPKLLLSALSIGSLFIRKCKNGSLINIYSDYICGNNFNINYEYNGKAQLTIQSDDNVGQINFVSGTAGSTDTELGTRNYETHNGNGSLIKMEDLLSSQYNNKYMYTNKYSADDKYLNQDTLFDTYLPPQDSAAIIHKLQNNIVRDEIVNVKSENMVPTILPSAIYRDKYFNLKK